MKKSELKEFIFECYVEHLRNQDRMLREGWNDDEWDDEPYKRSPSYSDQDMNNLETAIELAIEEQGGVRLRIKDRLAHVMVSPITSGLREGYLKVVITWEDTNSKDTKYGIGWNYVEGSVNPKIDITPTVHYLIHKVMRKFGMLKEALEDKQSVFGEGEVLPDSTDQILAKFPTLKHALVRLQTEQFREFVANIDWISPKPTEFRINLKNGQNFILKWMGKDFEATISGKRYYLGQLVDFQRALQKLADLYQEGPMGEEGSAEGGEPAPKSDKGPIGGGTGGDFPGGGSEEMPAEGPEEEGPEGESGEEDMSNAEIDFESEESI